MRRVLVPSFFLGASIFAVLLLVEGTVLADPLQEMMAAKQLTHSGALRREVKAVPREAVKPQVAAMVEELRAIKTQLDGAADMARAPIQRSRRAARAHNGLRSPLGSVPQIILNRKNDPKALIKRSIRQHLPTQPGTVDGSKVSWRRDGSVAMLKSTPGAVLQRSLRGFESPEANNKASAIAFLNRYKDTLKIQDIESELKLKSRQHDSLHGEHLRFSQYHAGLPVWNSEVVVHIGATGGVTGLTGNYLADSNSESADPVVSAEAAVEIASSRVSDGGEATLDSDPELVFHKLPDGQATLVWQVELTAKLTSRWTVLVNAIDGEALLVRSKVLNENVAGSGEGIDGRTLPLSVYQDGDLFYMIDTSKPMFNATVPQPSTNLASGAIVVVDALNLPNTDEPQSLPDLFYVTSNSAAGGWLPDAVSASHNLSETYDYFFERHNRNSVDGNGIGLFGVVQLGNGYQNAFFDSETQLMAFGDGLPFAGALDVVAHELTHGVTSNTANLLYLGESGAINEGMSDIFGELVEGRTFGSPDWVTGASLGEIIRSLKAPASLQWAPGEPYPVTMSDFVDLPYTEAGDYGGVHINSSIINHTFYQIAEGLPGAVGITAAEKLFYRALTVYLFPQARFADLRRACIQAAEDLYGAGSNPLQAVTDGFDGAQIFDLPPAAAPLPASEINAEDSTLFLYVNDLVDSPRLELGRRETALSDEALGSNLATSELTYSRPSVTGNGEIAAYINSDNAICFRDTKGEGDEFCVSQGQVYSISLSADGQWFGFVLLDENGEPTPKIFLANLDSPSTDLTEFDLVSPVFDGIPLNTVITADAMDITSDGRFIVYDALSQLQLADGSSTSVWSIYRLDTVSGITESLIPPIPGFDIAYPALGQLSDQLVTFDVYDEATNKSSIYTMDLFSGQFEFIAEATDTFGIPSFNGDDRAIVYMSEDVGTSTGVSIYRVELQEDSITAAGTPTEWLADAGYAVIYRRGTYVSQSAADLKLSQAISPVGNIAPGDVIRLTVSVENLGPGSASHVRVTSTLPAQFEYQSYSLQSGLCELDGRQLNCSLAALVAGTQIDLGITGRASSEGAYSVAANVTSANTEVNTVNNQSFIDFTVAERSGSGGGSIAYWVLVPLGLLGWRYRHRSAS